MPTKTCPACGRKVDERLGNCPGCGGRWHDDGTFSVAPDVRRPLSEPPAPQTPSHIRFGRRWLWVLIAVDTVACIGVAVYLLLRAT